jgi:hypothetical protein
MEHVSDLGYASLVHQSRVHLFGLAHRAQARNKMHFVIEVFPHQVVEFESVALISTAIPLGTPNQKNAEGGSRPDGRQTTVPAIDDEQTSYRKPELALKIWTSSIRSGARPT